ncbi:MAG: PepSY-like domain-containing protein [Prevotella sp.]
MKKHFLSKVCMVIATMMLMPISTQASNDKPISVAQLPQAAQKTLSAHFSKNKVALAKMESGLFEKSYEVVFTNGDKVEFDGNGKWKELSCTQTSVPATLIPVTIRNYVKTHYSNTRILELERERRHYDVKLSNRLELKFDKNGKLLDIED